MGSILLVIARIYSFTHRICHIFYMSFPYAKTC